MADMDQGVKRLLERHPANVLALAVPGTEYPGPLPTELVTEPRRVLDLLFRVRYRGVERAANVEVEARPRPEIARRLFEYGARVASNVGLPVLSIVLWLERAGAPPVLSDKGATCSFSAPPGARRPAQAPPSARRRP